MGKQVKVKVPQTINRKKLMQRSTSHNKPIMNEVVEKILLSKRSNLGYQSSTKRSQYPLVSLQISELPSPDKAQFTNDNNPDQTTNTDKSQSIYTSWSHNNRNFSQSQSQFGQSKGSGGFAQGVNDN